MGKTASLKQITMINAENHVYISSKRAFIANRQIN